MGLSDGQESLEQELGAVIDRATDCVSLITLTGEVLHELLRRKGDGEFLALIQDAFVEGLAGRSFAEQKALAREVFAVVLSKRPEIALAWKAAHGGDEEPPVRRRAADQVEAPSSAPSPPPMSRPAKPAFAHDRAEALVAEYVAEVFDHRLQIFQVGEPVFPSSSYRHEQSFFLFNPAFARVAREFLAGSLMVECRDALERHLYRHIDPVIEGNEAALRTFLEEKRPQAWKILVEMLAKLAGHHRAAEAKLAAPRDGETAEPQFREVEVPVSRPRVLRVLGVEFVLGKRTTMRKKKVRVKAANELNKDELRALELITLLRNMVADEGIDLPPTCDFMFLKAVLEFDAKKYVQALKELRALAAHEETSRAFLLERLQKIEDTYANHLADAMVLMLFTEQADNGFGFKETYDICIGTAKTMDAVALHRPFLLAEIGRRPRDLAYQLREALQRRYDVRTVAQAAGMMLTVWSVLNRTRFTSEMEAALTVLEAFPMAFAGDPDQEAFGRIGGILKGAMEANEMDVRATVDEVTGIYAPIAQRLRSALT